MLGVFFYFSNEVRKDSKMKIKKVLNNNVAIAINKQGEEMVIMGKGLAFQKKAGDEVSKEQIEKHFCLKDTSVNDKLGKLIADIPIEHLTLSEEIIQYAMTSLKKELDETIYLTLTDHIHFAIIRHRQNQMVTNKLAWEVKKFYKEEYKIGIYAIELINKRLGIHLPQDEAANIALHIANAEAHESMSITLDIIKIVEDILNIVKYYFIIDFDEESLDYFRFLTHIKFFAQRLLNKEVVEASNDELFEIMKEKIPEAYECTVKIKRYIEKYYDYVVNNDEMMYLMLHINRLVQGDKLVK